MKHLTTYLLAVTMLAACTNTETDIPQPGTGSEDGEAAVLGIRGLNLSVETKSIFDGIGTTGAGNELGRIGVLVTKLDGATVKPYSTSVNTQVFTYDGTGWTPDQALKLANVDGTLYAWAPTTAYTAALTATGVKEPILKSVKVLSAQQFNAGANEWDTNQEDFLYGSAAATVGDVTHHTVNKWDNTVDLYMQHAMAKISFKIKKADGQTVTADDFVKKIELTGGTAGSTPFWGAARGSTAMTLNLISGDFAGLPAAESLTFTAGLSTSAQLGAPGADYSGITHAQAYGLVAPVVVGTMNIKMTLGPSGALSAITDRTYETQTNLTGVTWEKGKHYMYTMTATDQELVVSDVEVIGWDDTPATEVPVE